jgi:hypothetical protein
VKPRLRRQFEAGEEVEDRLLERILRLPLEGIPSGRLEHGTVVFRQGEDDVVLVPDHEHRDQRVRKLAFHLAAPLDRDFPEERALLGAAEYQQALPVRRRNDLAPDEGRILGELPPTGHLSFGESLQDRQPVSRSDARPLQHGAESIFRHVADACDQGFPGWAQQS